MILSCHNISKTFVSEPILRSISFGIEEGEKAAIVGINGAGKSTLLRIITGELSSDTGEVVLAKGKTLGYLAQQKMVTGHKTIYEELRETKQYVFDMERDLRALEEEISTCRQSEDPERMNALMDQYHLLTLRYEQENGYQAESDITGVLRGLGFSDEEFGKSSDTLSGGQRTRIALGKLLLSSPDIILLDEPTNHLDLRSIRWLEGYLQNYRGAVIIVAHDRYFLDRTVTKVIEIDRGMSMTFQGNYSDYAVKKRQILDAQLKAWMNQQQEIRHQEEVIARLRSYNREKSIRRAESRVKMLEKMDVLEKPVEENVEMHLTLRPRFESGKDVLAVEDLAKSFGPSPLFDGIGFSIRRGERVALIGDNGTGKTTILRIINSLLDADRGSVTLGANVSIGYYDQEHQVLHAEKTLFEEISDAYPSLNNTQIRDTLAAFLFTGDDVFKRVGDISGGERGRVALAKLMLSDANFLILDEPTNHLDIFSREILENALCSYTGTLLYVSHDRYFINRTATRILELEDCRLFNYLGNYDYYLEKHDVVTAIPDQGSGTVSGAGTGRSAAAPSSASAASGASAPGGKEEWLRAKEEQAALRRREAELKKTEERIAALEDRDAQIDTLLTSEEVFTDMEKCRTLAAEKDEIAAELAGLYEAWERLAE